MLNVEQYLLVQLMEECAELQQACSKALRFGLEESYSSLDITNGESIHKELTDIYGVIGVIQACNMLPIEIDHKAIEDKVIRVHKYMQVSRDLGILEQ